MIAARAVLWGEPPPAQGLPLRLGSLFLIFKPSGSPGVGRVGSGECGGSGRLPLERAATWPDRHSRMLITMLRMGSSTLV